MATGKPFFTDFRLSALTPGAVRGASDGRVPAGNHEQMSHSIGVIGSSRPGSRIADHSHAHLKQFPSNSSNSQSGWPESKAIEVHAPPPNQREPLTARASSSSAYGGHSSSGGYALSSSMWAVPPSTGAQPSFPHQDLHPNNLNTGFSAGLSVPLLKEPRSVSNVPCQLAADTFERHVGSPAGQVSNTLHPSPELPLSRIDGNLTLNSPALSFTQTGSAPSTGRSLLASDGNASQPKSGMFNGYSFAPGDENNPYSVALKKLNAPYLSPRKFTIENALNEPPWPLSLSFGEEAFYSKSNVTKAQAINTETESRSKSPTFWKTLDGPLMASNNSPSNENRRASLASPLTFQPQTNELMGQLLSRIEQLERKTVKQDQEIYHLKANISLASAQPPRETPSSMNMASNIQSANLFQSPVRGRVIPGHPTPTSNSNLAAGLNGESTAGLVVNGLQGGQSNFPAVRKSEDIPGQNAPSLNPVVSGFPQRQYGSLDYSSRRANSLASGGAMMPQSVPAAASQPSYAAPPALAPGIVNYRALLSGDTECDYEYFIRRITKHNDQQASIFMQQKLKQSAVTQSTEKNGVEVSDKRAADKPRQEITRLVIEYSLELMTNRFGNFLVSRAIEHAIPEERLELSERIKGRIVTLAQDTFATHCLQKMIDVDEEGDNRVRRMISLELLKKKETVTHKSAGHVWARLLSVGGGSSDTLSLNAGSEKISGVNQYGDTAGKLGGLESSLNELLKGEWAATSKDEVGSLIVQSVLENWNEAAKADVVEELLTDIYSCAVQQWGNFVILHLIEHSSGAIQKKLFERLTETQLACELSIDNFGAKAIEKVLKVSGMESKIVEDYVKAICEYGNGRPALIDIACHQAGAQVLTLLFTSAPHSIRDLMIQTVRRNGVTMKSSKAGSKIWFLVERTRAWVGH